MGVSVEQFVENLTGSGLMSADEVSAFQQSLANVPTDGETIAKLLVRNKKLTRYQATAVYQGKIKHLMFGEYVVTDKIGAGGMGLVLKARHRRMDRDVAVKVLPAKAVQDKSAEARFYQEVKAAAKLIHTNIVVAFEAGENEGLHYLIMEYVEGKDLAAIVHERGRLPVEQAVECIRQAAHGLQYAHDEGIVHRDIKPGNLLLDKKGTVKILDMGLARLNVGGLGEGEEKQPEQLTQSGQIMGTVDYMAPEQAEDTRKADHRADIYALGCTLFRLVTGSPVYERDTVMQKLLAHREDEIPSMVEHRSDVPARLAGVFQRMVAKDPDERYQSMTEVIAALDTAFIPAPQAAKPAAKRESSSSTALSEFFEHIGDQNVAVKKQTAAMPEETIDQKPVAEDTGDNIDEVEPPPAIGLSPPGIGRRPKDKKTSRTKQQKQKLLIIGGGSAVVAVLLIVMAIVAFGPRKTGDDDVLDGGGLVNERSEKAEKANLALEFDGDRSYVRIPTLIYDGGTITIEANIRFHTTHGYVISNPGRHQLYCAHRYSFQTYRQRSDSNYEKLACNAGLPNVDDPNTPLHAVFQFDGKIMQIYLDGRMAIQNEQFVAPSKYWVQVPREPGMYFGATLALNATNQLQGHFGGTLDEIRISNIVRYTEDFTPPQPHERFTPDEHTLALYHCDEIKDGKLIDSSGNGHHGDVHNCKLVRVGPPPLAKAPFGEAEARQHQKAWADYLGMEVERDIELPGGEKLTMVLIPPGEFMMGSTVEEQAKFLEEAKAVNDQWSIDHIPCEGPQHRVRITKPFYLAKYEVTQAQWQSVMHSNPSKSNDNPSCPVFDLSWDDIQPFLAKLNEGGSAVQGRFALPTEAQWEYACRAGTTTPHYGGETENDLAQYGWFLANSGGKIHPVGELKRNAFGLYDMHGNVWEWCADFFALDYYGKSPLDDPTGPSAAFDRVDRGGNYSQRASACRSAIRNHSSANYRGGRIGFRLAAAIADPSASSD